MKKNLKTAISAIVILSLFILTGCQSQQQTQSTNSDSQSTSTQTDNANTAKSTAATTASSAKSYDPCDLLDLAAVSKFFPDGTPDLTKHDTEANAIGQKICFYSLSPTEQEFVQLSLISEADMPAVMIESGQTVESIFKTSKDYSSVATPVDGLGSDAYFGGSGLTPGSGINVLVPEKRVSFTVNVGLGFGNDDAQAHISIERAVGEYVLSKL